MMETDSKGPCSHTMRWGVKHHPRCACHPSSLLALAMPCGSYPCAHGADGKNISKPGLLLSAWPQSKGRAQPRIETPLSSVESLFQYLKLLCQVGMGPSRAPWVPDSACKCKAEWGWLRKSQWHGRSCFLHRQSRFHILFPWEFHHLRSQQWRLFPVKYFFLSHLFLGLESTKIIRVWMYVCWKITNTSLSCKDCFQTVAFKQASNTR